ncbi:hypothetical protein JR316_0004273 [Psilocybe cubensis]|uniref:Uncharacterized protein n=2 Tax=Psilocybe cubensis TaxID=181762 RepID=A0ACB8H2F6_PSICU|nr:hypothetical protein JR316_0004273 [Psilocybe cubensis]KAH9482178.1 hypothetical protein JR316_0004273 [Psilocybe cubensis]
MASAHVASKSSVLDEATLVDQLNTLLSSLNIPITLVSPTDLTPSLLIAILESMLNMRIPLIDRSQQAKYSKASKVQNMKIFLGFLEIDVMKMDVGLSDIDPRRLADGEEEEISFVAELLCWMGRREGLIQTPRTHKRQSIAQRYHTPPQSTPPPAPLSPKSQLDLDAISLFQTGSTATGSTRRSHHLFSPFMKDTDKESFTTLDAGEHDVHDEHPDESSDNVSDVLSALPPFAKSDIPQPPCDHEYAAPSSSLLFSRDYAQPSTPAIAHSSDRTPRATYNQPIRTNHDTSNVFLDTDDWQNQSNTSVRYSGYIEPVDEELELAEFEHSRSLSIDRPRSKGKTRSVKIETVQEQYERTRELLNERARLLNQLAELKISHG